MAVFDDARQLYELLGGFFRAEAASDEARFIAEQNLVVQFVYHEPEARITIGPAGSLAGAADVGPGGSYLDVAFGDVAAQPELVFEMKAEVAHRFWLGRVNLPMALARQQVKARGPLSKALKLLPTLERLFPRYARYLQQHGAEALLSA